MVLAYKKTKVRLAAVALHGDVVWVCKLVLNLYTCIGDINAWNYLSRCRPEANSLSITNRRTISVSMRLTLANTGIANQLWLGIP